MYSVRAAFARDRSPPAPAVPSPGEEVSAGGIKVSFALGSGGVKPETEAPGGELRMPMLPHLLRTRG